MVYRHLPPSLPLTRARRGFRHTALAGLAALGLAGAPGCEQVTGGDPPAADVSSGTDNGSGPGADGNGPVNGIDPARLRFVVSGGRNVDFGGVFEPMTAQGLKPYSFSMNSVTIANTGAESMRIQKVELVAIDGAFPSEWTIRANEAENAPIVEIEPFDLASGEGIAIATRYFPQQTGTSRARFIVTDDKGDSAEIIISARCRDAAFVSEDVTPEWTINWGHGNSTSKFLPSGLVADGNGNSYLTGNATNWGDQFNHNIVVARLGVDGTVGWAREWNEPYAQEQQDTGQNGQTGGSEGAIAHGGDGHVYVAGRRSTADTNNTWQALVLKVSETDGALAWSKGLVPTAESDVGAEAYAIDASLPDRVLVVGNVTGEGGILFAAISKATGEPIFAYGIGIGSSGVDRRGYGISANANGEAYLVGWSGDNIGFVLRFKDCNTNEPTMEWARAIGLGVGSSAHTVHMGDDGNAYVGFDIRGATSLFAFARFNKDGSIAWNKYYDERNQGDHHTQYVMRKKGDHVYVAGRIGLDSFDYTGGDALLLRVAASDGAYDWASIFYTGTTAETQGDHRVKGLAWHGDKLHVLMHHWTGQRNSFHYWGHWYRGYDAFIPEPTGDGSAHLGDYDLTAADITNAETTTVTRIETARAIDIDATTIWTDVPGSVKATPSATMSGNGGHHTATLHRLTIN